MTPEDEVRELREAYDRLTNGIYERLDWIERDRREPDKVLANALSIRSLLAHEWARLTAT